MADLSYAKHERLFLKGHPKYDERWVQDRIAEEPSIVGLGNLVLRDKERFQPRAGRLDLLLQDPETWARYEVEVQLGGTDETHIIRTIEYWDIERKRYPQYEHTAVLIAEDITSRFLNVIGLFNGFIPLVAIQMNAIRLGDAITLVFTKVLDQMTLGFEEEEEEGREVVDRGYWEKRATKESVALADQLLELVHGFAPGVQFTYNKFYLGLAGEGRRRLFAVVVPQKSALRLEVRSVKSEQIEAKAAERGLDLSGYTKWGAYVVRLTKADLKQHSEFLAELMKQAHEESGR